MGLTKTECRNRVVEAIKTIDYTEGSDRSQGLVTHGALTEVDAESTPFSHIYEWKNSPLLPTSNERYSYGIVDDRKITEDSLDHVINSFKQLYNDKRLGSKRQFETVHLIPIAFTHEMSPELQDYIESNQNSDWGYSSLMLFVIECQSKTPFYNQYGKVINRHLHNFQKKTIRNVLNPALNA